VCKNSRFDQWYAPFSSLERRQRTNEQINRPFLYPGWDWAWGKIENRIAVMGETGTKVPVQKEKEM
jgi:hypothetical protein